MKIWKKDFKAGAGLCLVSMTVFLWPSDRGQTGELLASSAPAGEGVLRLEEAIRIALDNHPKIKAAKEKTGVQEAVLGQQLAAYYPTISESNTYRTSNSTGGGDSISERAADRFTGQASFSMTLYNFGKREGAVQSARDTVGASQQDYVTATNEVVLAVKQAYFVYLQASALVVVRKETVKDRELLVRQAQGFYEVGTKPKIDVARAESNFYNAQADLISAQNAVKVAWTTLKNAMGSPDFPERPLADELSVPPVSVSLEEAKKAAFAARPELKSFESQRKAQDQKIAAARRGHLPDILLSATYGRTGSSPRTFGPNRDPTFPLDPTWSTQLSLNIPIFDGFNTTYKVEEAVRNYYSIRAQEESQKQQVALEVEQGYVNLINAQERIKATEAAAKAAKENLDLANGRYQVGVGSIIEVTEAQTLYTDAATKHIQSIYDYKIAEAQLVKAVGRQ